jgi:hypothetical protein
MYLPPGKLPLVKPWYNASSSCFAQYRIGHRARRGQGRQHTVPGVALQPVKVAASTDIRCALDRQVDMTAPGELELDTFQLRKHAFETRPGSAGDVFGHAAQISAATAEQQPVVRRATEIIEHELVVGDADVARQQRCGLFLGASAAVATW